MLSFIEKLSLFSFLSLYNILLFWIGGRIDLMKENFTGLDALYHQQRVLILFAFLFTAGYLIMSNVLLAQIIKKRMPLFWSIPSCGFLASSLIPYETGGNPITNDLHVWLCVASAVSIFLFWSRYLMPHVYCPQILNSISHGILAAIVISFVTMCFAGHVNGLSEWIFCFSMINWLALWTFKVMGRAK